MVALPSFNTLIACLSCACQTVWGLCLVRPLHGSQDPPLETRGQAIGGKKMLFLSGIQFVYDCVNSVWRLPHLIHIYYIFPNYFSTCTAVVHDYMAQQRLNKLPSYAVQTFMVTREWSRMLSIHSVKFVHLCNCHQHQICAFC